MSKQQSTDMANEPKTPMYERKKRIVLSNLKKIQQLQQQINHDNLIRLSLGKAINDIVNSFTTLITDKTDCEIKKAIKKLLYINTQLHLTHDEIMQATQGENVEGDNDNGNN